MLILVWCLLYPSLLCLEAEILGDWHGSWDCFFKKNVSNNPCQYRERRRNGAWEEIGIVSEELTLPEDFWKALSWAGQPPSNHWTQLRRRSVYYATLVAMHHTVPPVFHANGMYA